MGITRLKTNQGVVVRVIAFHNLYAVTCRDAGANVAALREICRPSSLTLTPFFFPTSVGASNEKHHRCVRLRVVDLFACDVDANVRRLAVGDYENPFRSHVVRECVCLDGWTVRGCIIHDTASSDANARPITTAGTEIRTK